MSNFPAFRSDSEFDSVLDSLGHSFMDRVPVEINPRFSHPTQLIRQVESLLSTPTPGEQLIQRFSMGTNGEQEHDWVGRVERQVLQQLRAIDEMKAKKEEQERKEMEEFEERKRKEKEEEERKKKEEEERKQKEEEERERKKKEEEENERKKKENEEENDDKEEDEDKSLTDEDEDGKTVTPVEKPASAPPGPRVNPTQPIHQNPIPGLANMAIANPGLTNNVFQQNAMTGTRFNFSEFEAESDPFDSMELKTIDEKQELAAVLQTTKAQTNPVLTNPNQTQNPIRNSNPFYPGYSPRFPQQHFPVFPSDMRAPHPPMNVYPPQRGNPFYPPYPVPNSTPPYPVSVQSEMTTREDQSSSSIKSSKSVGDLVSEINKEEKKNLTDNVKAKKPSFTPPPRVGAVGLEGVRSGLEDWVPWPELDEPKDPYSILTTPAEKQLCRQIHEMGFPLDRVLRICQALGTGKEDSGQQMINFCLLVDKFVTAEGFDESETEHVLLLKSMDEEQSRKHLLGFRKLKDLGFPSKAVHDALVECQSDQEKALEKLLA